MFLYKPNFIPISFAIIGCGGTGGRLVPLLAQFLKTANWIQNPKIYVIDHDVVEEKNLIRQNFIKLDLGKPKAIVMAERYSKAFDINIVPVVKKIETAGIHLDAEDHAEHGVTTQSLHSLMNAIIVLCVDNAEARRNILKALMIPSSSKNLLILDAGNENDFGQIQIFNDSIYTHSPNHNRAFLEKLPIEGLGIPFDVEVPIIPYPTNFYESLKDIDAKSCAELDQTLAINATMATSLMGIIQNVMYQKLIPFHRLNISLTSGIIPEMMSLKYLIDGIYDRSLGKPRVAWPRAIDISKVFTEIANKIGKFKNVKSSEEKNPKENKENQIITSAPMLSVEELLHTITHPGLV